MGGGGGGGEGGGGRPFTRDSTDFTGHRVCFFYFTQKAHTIVAAATFTYISCQSFCNKSSRSYNCNHKMSYNINNKEFIDCFQTQSTLQVNQRKTWSAQISTHKSMVYIINKQTENINKQSYIVKNTHTHDCTRIYLPYQLFTCIQISFLQCYFQSITPIRC